MSGDPDTAGRKWAKFKLDWLDRVADDVDKDHLAFRVAHTIARLADTTSGITDWSQIEIARRAGTSRRSLQLSIDKLETRGHLIVIPKTNRNRGNRYRPVLKTADPHAQPIAHETLSHAQPIAHETALRHAQPIAHETPSHAQSHAQNSTISCAAHCAPIPVTDPRRSPRQPSSSVTVTALATTTEPEDGAAAPLSDDELLSDLRNAAAGNIVDGPGIRDLQPIRALIAEGIDLDRTILPAVSSRVVMLSAPLRTWRAPWLLDAIRAAARSATETGATVAPAAARPIETPPPRVAPPSVRSTPPPRPRAALRSFELGADDPPAEEVYRVGTRVISASDLRLVVNAFYERNIWPDDMGPPPGRADSLLPPMTSSWSPPPGDHPLVRISGQMPRPEESVWAIVRLYRDGGTPWPDSLGTEPGTPGCLLPQRFQDAALLNRKTKDGGDA